MATRPGGYGQEAFGDPFGAGGPLHVVRARAVRGQVVRVVFDEEPVHRSPIGKTDALNQSNYLFSVVSGQATAPQAVGVDRDMIVGPTVAVAAGDERAFDVHTDLPLIVGIRYRVTVVDVRSRFGGALGAPFTAEFEGLVQLSASRPPARKLELLDIENDPFRGTFVVDSSGDLAPHGGVAGLRKRILRRLTTVRGAFRFLPTYGIGLRVKELANPAELQGLKTDIVQQLREEPEVEAVEAALTVRPDGVTIVGLRVSVRRGALFELSVARTADGAVVIV